MRALAGIILATSALLGGCASIPFSTAVRLSSLNLQTLAQIDPTQVRVRLSVPAGYELDIPASKLKLSLASRSYGSRSGSMALTLLQTTRDIRPGGLFGSDTTVSTYLLSLSPEGGRQLHELQQFVLSGQPEQFAFSVHAPFTKIPPTAIEVVFWADLKLSLGEPFMPLIDGAKIRFEGSSASS